MADDTLTPSSVSQTALYPVLAALTTYDAAQWADAPARGGLVVDDNGVRFAEWPSGATWTTTDPAEAMELLTTAGVLPPGWVDDPLRAWVCDRCDGTALLPVEDFPPDECSCAVRCAACGGVESEDDESPCTACGGAGVISQMRGVPAGLPALVAWASLGAEVIAQAEALARTVAERLRPWGVASRERRIVWRITDATRGVGDSPMVGWPLAANDPLDAAYDPTTQLDLEVNGDPWGTAYNQSRDAGEDESNLWWTAHVKAWPEEAPPCPHEPVLELLHMGLALDAINNTSLVIACPPLAGTP